MSLFPSRHYNSSQIYLSLSFYLFHEHLFLHGHLSFVRFICVPLCSSLVHLHLLQQSMYSTVTSPCRDFHSYSLRNIVKISATPPAIFCPQWQQRSLPLIEVHLRESTLVVEVCVCVCLFLCLCGSLSDWASEFECISSHRIHSW